MGAQEEKRRRRRAPEAPAGGPPAAAPLPWLAAAPARQAGRLQCQWHRPRSRLLVAALLLLRIVPAAGINSGSFFVGGRGSGLGRFRRPIGITPAPNGDLVIADTDNHRVQRCRSSGACYVVAGNSTPGAAPNQVHFPYGVAVLPDDTLFVVDTFNNRIQRWDPGATEGITVMSNNFTSYHGVQLGGSHELEYPLALTFNLVRGHMYVVDTGQHRVRRYDIDMTSKNVTSTGITVAGTTGVFGPNLTQFDNPVGITFQQSTNSFWVVDSRNYRVVRWAENATEGVVEMDGFRGKPYGIYQTDRATYVADSGDCRVLKLLNGNVTITVAGGNGCGFQMTQLQFPSGLYVDSEGTIYIADTQNDRIVRWFPTPRPVGNVLCYFNSHCGVILRDGEPTEGNRLVIVNKTDTEVACGRVCHDPKLDGANWSSVAVPVGDWVSDMTYDFGTPSLGDYGEYYMCWGPAPNMDDVSNGDCRGVPYTMGVLTVFPNVYPDENATRNTSQCVKGGRCYVDIWGYAFPEGTVENPNMIKSKGTEALSPPNSVPGSGVLCGADEGVNFVGYREFVSVNPAQTVVFRRPYAYTGNLTSIATVDFNLAMTIGRRSLCICYDGILCYRPQFYGSYAGTFLTRGTIGGESWVCQLKQSCSITIRGQFLLTSDIVGLVSWEAPCLALLMSNTTNVSSVVVPLGASSNDHTEARIDFGLFPSDGRYKICYCGTYDHYDPDAETCNAPDEYTQDAGALSVIRVLPHVYECPVSRPCVVTAYGMDLSPRHRMLVGDGNPEVCGFAGVVEYSLIYGVETRTNVFIPRLGGTAGAQTFELDTFTHASPKSACYCTDYDQQIPFIEPPGFGRRLADGVCNDPVEFYQPMGPIVVRGPALSQPRCIMDRLCNISVPGIDLSAEDKLLVCPEGHRCGEAAGCVAPGPSAAAGIQRPASANASATAFALGRVPLGLYELCYCAPGNASSPSAIPCDSPADLTMQAVLLRVRGVRPEQRLSCIVGNPCTVTVEGLDVGDSDKMQIAPLDSTCGNATSVPPGLFVPSANLNATPGSRSNLEQDFAIASTASVGRFRVCYCGEDACLGVSDYYLDAGVLFVKGIQERYHAARCRLGESCSFAINGMGLVQGNDTVQIVPTYLGCGGAHVIVSGDDQTGALNGIYDRGQGLFETKPWYQKRGGGQYLFYDLYSYRWVLGPERNPDVPETAGWAWVEDLFTQDTTPDRVASTWQVWDQQSAWVDQPRLQVGRMTLPPGSIEENPSNATTHWVPDPEISFPYLVSERFQLGLATRLASYLICYCPALDGADNDGRTCSGDDEFLVPNGMLLVEVVRGNERHHCEQYGACTVRTVLPAHLRGTQLLVLLLPVDGRCNEGPFNTSTAWPNATNVSGRLLGAEGTFDLGAALVAGSFQVCLCTGYDDTVDGVPCSEPQEFYQQIGTLTVRPAERLNYELGQEALLNLTRGLGLNRTDALRFVEGDVCAANASAVLAMRPDAAAEGGEWAAYVLGRNGTSLQPGYYSACLCTAWDGGDAGERPCDDSAEYSAKVGVVTVSLVSSPVLTSSLTSSVELELRPRGGRRLSAANGSSGGNGTGRGGGTGGAASAAAEGLLTFSLATSVAEALRGAITAVLGAGAGSVSVPATLVDLLVTDASAPGRLGVTAGFVARLSGTAEQHLNPRPSPNASCPPSLVYAPWNNTGGFPAASQEELQACLWLGYAVGEGNASLTAELNSRLSRVAVPGISNVSVRSFVHGSLAPALRWEPRPSACIQGVPCDAFASSSAPLLPGGEIVVVEGEDALCGALPPPFGPQSVTSRAAAGFPDNPASAPVPAAPAQILQVHLQTPSRSGMYALCYCSDTGGAGSSCATDEDFYQRAGTLTVRGALAGLEFPCTSFTQCAFTVQGTHLTAWDRVMVVPWTSTCGFATAALDRIDHNPALAGRAAGVANGTEFRHYDLGVVTRIGKLRVCYCASFARSAAGAGSAAMGPCAYAGDYSLTGGTLWSRGVDSTRFRFSCVKDDIDTELCSLVLTGQGLLPGKDAVLLATSAGPPCGSAPAELADVFAPNPIAVEAGEPLAAWHRGLATAAGRWRVRAKRLGTYRVCFCPVAAGGSCSREADFFHQAGLLTVRGARGEEAYICRADDRCFIRVSGLGLSMRDRVKVIGGDQFCDWVGPGSPLVEINPAPAVEVSDDLGVVEFALGVVQPASSRMAELTPLTLRVCYCASQNIDLDGEPCSSGRDFTHSAGVINTVVCPRAPAASFNPPVQDVFGDPGDPHVRLFSIPQYTCEDTLSRTQEDLVLFSTPLAIRGRTAFNDSRLLVTKDGQCSPGVLTGAPVMNTMAGREIEVSVRGELRHSGSLPRGGDVRMRLAHHLHAVISVFDIRGQGHVCPIWEVSVVPVACGPTAAWLFGLLLHGTILFAASIFLLSNRLGHILRFVKALRREAFGLIEDLPVPEQLKANQKGQGATPSLSKGATSKTVTLKSAPIAAKQPEEPPLDDQGLASVLSNGRWASGVAIMRVVVLGAHLVSLLLFGQIPDAVMLVVIPLIIVILTLFLQFVVLARAAGLKGALAAILCPSPYVPPSQLGDMPDPGQVRFAAPPVLHSAAAVAKLHLDLSLPALARRHHCELWRVAFLLLAWIVLVQVICPLCSLLFNFMSPRRAVPSTVIPLALTVFGTLAGDEQMLGPKPLGLEPVVSREDDSEVDSQFSRSSKRSIWSFGSVASRASKSIRRISERFGFRSKDPPRSPMSSNQPTPKGSKEPARDVLGPLGGPGRLRPVMSVRGEEDVGAHKERERKKTLRKAAKQAMAERAARGVRRGGAGSKAVVQSVPETGELEPQDEEEEEEVRLRCRCRPCERLSDALARSFGRFWWVALVVASPPAPALREEMHRHRAVGLYAFMEASGWHVATGAARETVERVSGVSVAHMEGRWTMLYSLFGGLDLTAIHAFVAIAYAPRLSVVEFTVLVIAVLVGLVQASRPGTGRAVLWLMELCITGPWTFATAWTLLLILRFVVSMPLAWGCPHFTWGFSAWSCSVLALEVPLFLLWRRYHALPWNELRARAQQAAVDFLGASLGRARRCLRCCCCCCRRGATPKVADDEPATAQAALADAKPSKIAQAAPPPPPPPEWPEAEPLVLALKRLVEVLPEGLRMVLAEEEDGDICIIRERVEELFKLPPPRYDLEVRVKRLAGLDPLLKQLALKLEDEDKHCRKAFNDIVRLADEKLYRLRLGVDAVRLARSIHFRLGSLDNRAELAFEALPDSPQMWVVHWATLLSLGRLPEPDEREHLVAVEEVAKEFPGDCVLVPVIHRPRAEDNPDPHGVTCRQLVTFAKWYRAKFGLNLEIFFWIDCCCFPEVAEAEAEATRGDSRSGSRDSSKMSAGSAWSLPTSRESSKTSVSDAFSRGTRFSGASRFSRFSSSSRLSRLSNAHGMNIRNTVAKRGLKNLQALMEDRSDTTSVRSGSSGLASINFRDRTSVIGGLSEGASALVLKGRSGSKARSTKNFKTLSDLQRLKRDKDMGRDSRVSVKPQGANGALFSLGMENPDVNRDMLRDGADLVRLLVFAAADAVVLCETHDSEDCAWVRLGLALAHAFSPTGQFVYAVDRSLVHIPSARKPRAGEEVQPIVPHRPIPGLAAPISAKAFPGVAALEDGAEAGGAVSAMRTEVRAVTDGRGAAGIVSVMGAAPVPVDACVWRELIPDFMEHMVVQRQDHFLADPTDWGEVHLEDPGTDRARIVRLAALCLDRPTTLSVGGYRRPPLEFGASVVHVCRLEVKNYAEHQWKRALKKQRLAEQPEDRAAAKRRAAVPEESSSSSGEEEEEAAPDFSDVYLDPEEPTKFRQQRPVLDLKEHTLQLYHKNKAEESRPAGLKSKEGAAAGRGAAPAPAPRRPDQKQESSASQLLRRAADIRDRWGGEQGPAQTLHPLPSLRKLEQMVEFFHPDFRSRNVLIGSAGRTAEQFRASDSVTGRLQAGNPGLAVLSRPLRVRGAVCPDKYKARGVSFDLKVEATNPGWRDGLGIGFTAQDPDKWPADKLKPRHASQVPRTCTCGYSGRWMMDGRSELVHSLRPGQGAWEPGSLRVGDVVTAVVAAPPADAIRILVNGRLVAERPALSSGLPDPSEEPLWGIIELDGACAKVRLGAGEAPKYAADLTELATRAATTRAKQ